MRSSWSFVPVLFQRVKLVGARVFWLLLFLLISLQGWAQFTLEGKVVDGTTGEALPGAIVQIHPPENSSVTNSLGHFSFSKLPGGKVHVHVLYPGYEGWETSVSLTADLWLDVTLKPTYIELKEIVVEDASFDEGQRKSTLNSVAIHEDQLRDPSQNSFSEALAKTPGIDFINTGVGISKPVIRGMTGVRLQVNNQGIKQEGQQWGLDHGLEVDPFGVERVEVVKGAASLQFGGDATGGVIRILPDPIPTKKWSGRFTGIYKTNNQHLGGGAKASVRQGRFFSIGKVSRSHWNDYQIPVDEFTYNGVILPIADRTLKNTAGSETSAQLVAGWINESSLLRITGSWWNQRSGLFSGATGIPRYYDIIDIGDRGDIDLPRQDNTHWRVSIDGQQKLGKGWLKWDSGFQLNRRREESDPQSHGLQYIAPGDSLALGLDLMTLSLSPNYRFGEGRWDHTMGVDLQFQSNSISGWEYLIPDFRRSTEEIFWVSRFAATSGLSITAGLRGGFVQVHSDEHYQPYFNDPDSLVLRSPDLDRSWGNMAGSMGLTYQWAHDRLFRVNLSRSYRMPQVVELAGNGVHHGTFRHELGDPGLDPEEGWQLDLAAEAEGKKWFTRVGAFGYLFGNYIYLAPSGRFSPLPDAGQMYIYRQDGAAYMGAELLLEFHPWEALHLSGNLSYVQTRNLNSGLSLPFTPPLNSLISSSYEWNWGVEKKWTARVNGAFDWSATQDQVDRNEKPTPGYSLFHAGVELGWDTGDYLIQISVQGRNLFDTPYLKHLSRYKILNLSEQGRNVALGLTLSF